MSFDPTDPLGLFAAPAPAAAQPAQPAQPSDQVFDSLLMQESGGRQTGKDGQPITSSAGAIGIAQVMPGTAPEAAALAGLPWDANRYKTDAEYNKALGRAYFNKQMQDFGNVPMALAAYNAGPGAVRQAVSRASSSGGDWLSLLPAETQNYVPSVLAKAKVSPTAQPSAASPQRRDQFTPGNDHLVGGGAPAKGATAGDFGREFGASFLTGVGAVGQFVGEGAAWLANAATGTEDYAGKNLLEPAAQGIRAGMTEGGRAALQASQIGGDILDPSTWELPQSADGWLMVASNGLGSVASSLLPMVGPSARVAALAKAGKAAEAAAAARTATIIGAAAGGAQTGGAAAGEVRDSAQKAVDGMTHEQLLANVPIYAQAIQSGADEATARQAVVNGAARLAGGLASVAGAAGGAFNAKVIEDVLLHRGIAKALGGVGGGLPGRMALGTAGGVLTEGPQEGAEKVGQNVGENIGLGRPAMQDATRNTAGDVFAGALTGGLVGGPVGGASPHPTAVKAMEPNTPLSKAATAGNIAIEAQGPAPAPVDPAQRLAELEAIAKGSADTQNADGQTIPGQPKRIFTAEEKAEYDTLRAQRDATPGATPDDITPKAFAIRDQLRADRGVLDALRADTSPTKPQAFLKDLSIATSKSAQPAMREQALARVEMAMEWAASNPAPAIEANLDALPGLAQGDARPDAPRPTATQLRAGADRDAELLAQRDGAPASRAGASTRAEADRREQAAIDIESSPRATPEALDRAVALRQQAAALRRRADEADAQPGAAGTAGEMTERDRAGIDEQRQINLERNMRAPATDRPQAISERDRPRAIGAHEQAQLEAAALAGGDQIRRREDEPRQVVIDRALRNVEERGGVASPAEARIFQEAGVGKPHDRVDESLADELSTDEKLTQATGIALGRAPRESTRQGQQSEADLVAQEQRDRSDSRMQALAAERKAAQAGQPAAREPAAAPAADEVIGALKTIPALRTAEQKTVVDAARRGYTAEQMRVMNDAAVNPANLSATDKLQLQQMREARKSEERAAEPQALPDVAIPAGAGPAFLRKRKAQIEAAAAQGYETVERRDGVFVMRNAKTGAEVRLSGRADAALAREAIRKMVDERAHAAATSPKNDRKEPSWAQIDAINWKKGDPIPLNGVTVRIENPVGSVRRARPDAPVQWKTTMKHHYGEIAGTKGVDGDPVDVFIGPNPASSKIWVIDQVTEDGKLDEHKVMFGFDSEAAARAGYLSNFSSGWKGLDKITEMTQDEFRAWIKDQGATMAPAAEAAVAAAPDIATTVEPETGTFTVRMEGKNVKFERRGVDALGENESPERDGKATRIGKKSAALIKAIAKAMGKKVVFFADVNGVRPGDGFVVPNEPDTIYLNEVSTINPLAVMGHEFLHTLRQTNPKAWDAIAAVVKTRVKDAKGFRRDYYGAEEADARGDGALGEAQGGELEELVSDLGGNLMSDPKFWGEVFDKIRAENGADAKGIIARLIATLQSMIDKIAGTVKGRKFKADDPENGFVTDLDAIRAAYRDGLAAYLQQSGESKAGMQAEVLKSTQRDRRAQAESMSMTGYHFSREPRKSLSSATHGQGLQDANREQFQEAADPRIRQRIYFYVDKGTGITPLPGLGTHAHRTKLSGVYDMNKDALELRKGKKLEAFESAVLDAGFQGYLDRRDGTQPGVVIMLGKRSIEPEYLGIMGSIKDGEKLPGASAPDVARPPISKSLMSKEIDSVDTSTIPGAKMRAGILTIPAESRDAANAEMARIGSPIRFSKERLSTPAEEIEAVRKKYEGTDQWLKAPNGRPSNLSERQWLHVRTPSFRAWFGDWLDFAERGVTVWNDDKKIVSKVVDSQGEPMVVYHGSDKGGFVTFNRPGGKKRGDLGIFTTDDLSMARTYVRRGRGRMLTADEVSEDDNEGGGIESGVYALFLNIRNPQEESFEGANWDGQRLGQFVVMNDDGEQLYTDTGVGYFEDRDDAFALVMQKGGNIEEAPDHWIDTDGVVREARSMRNDGAIIRSVRDDGGGYSSYSGDPADLFVALKPNQVKSADFNSGEYSVTDDDIRKSVERENKHGFAPELLDRVKGKIALPEKRLFMQVTNSVNVADQTAAIDKVLSKFPNPEDSINDWNRMMAYALADKDVPIPPYQFIKRVASGDYGRLIGSLSAGQVADADHGFENAAEFRKLYESGEADAVTTGKLLLWSFLSRGVSPYVQESLFIDSVTGIDPWLEIAADGKFDEAAYAEYSKWSENIAGKGSGLPGAGAKHNLNAFGRDFLFKMSERLEDGRTKLQTLHDLIADFKNSGPMIRREFLRLGESAGIDNKVISFTLLVSGRTDVMVLDRVQIKGLWDDGRFASRNLYDGWKADPADKSVISGSKLSDLFSGARGVLVYEALERAIGKRVREYFAAAGRPEDASLGRFHWETWVQYSGQEASHGSIQGLMRDTAGKAQPYANIGVKQGEYGAFAYGARYAIDARGQPYFLYDDSTGSTYQFSIPSFVEFQGAIKASKNGVVRSSFGVSKDENGQDRTQPWFSDPRVNRARLDDLVRKFGNKVEGARAVPQDAAGAAADGAGPRRSAARITDFDAGNIGGILEKTDWAILTAENPRGQQATPEFNEKAQKLLRADLRELGAEFRDIEGSYGQKENSIAVAGITEAQATELGRKYDQDSILTRKGLIYQDGSINPAGGVEVFREAPEDFYSRIGDTIFRINIDFDTKLEPDVLKSSERQTDTAEFKMWSDGAPVVSVGSARSHAFETGEPVVIEGFHGTRSDISEFSLGRSSGGFFHSDNPRVSGEYAGDLPGVTAPPIGGNVQRNYVRMKNPLFINARGASFNRVDTRGVAGYPDPMSSTDTINRWARDQGHDGVVYRDLRDSVSKPDGRNGIPSLVFAAFDSRNVKSATGNSGQFDGSNLDITKSLERKLSMEPDQDLIDLFEDLGAAGQRKKRAEAAADSHPRAQQIRQVNDNILDLLEELESKGSILINCD